MASSIGSTCATATQQLLEVAAVHGARPALIPQPPGRPYSFADLRSTVEHAAAGLAWQGLRPRDIVAVHVPDAASFLLARHAISAAGGVPCPVGTGLSAAEIAGQLADCGARILITAPPLATAGLAAADRSLVRQVISFGEVPAATPFGSLLGMGTLRPPAQGPHELALLAYARLAGGDRQAVGMTHLDLADQLADLAAAAEVGPCDVVLAAPPAGDGRSYAVFTDHVLLRGATLVATALDALAAAAGEYQPAAAIVPAGVAVAGPPLRLFAVTA